MKLGEIKVEYVDHMGSDLNIVNAARVSFDKQVETIEEKDVKLMQYLAEHEHTSPFRHTCISVRCKAPIFLARQLVKHQVGLSWNEVSRRYVDSEPEYYMPETLHGYPSNKKQGCGEVLEKWGLAPINMIRKSVKDANVAYLTLVDMGVAPEEARMVLPLNTMTEWIWTGSLQAFFHVYRLRSDSHAQTVAREFAEELGKVISEIYPNAWKVLVESQAKL